MGRLGDGTTQPRSTPVLVHSGVTAAWAGQGSLFLTQAGELWTMGDTGPSSWKTIEPKKVATSVVGAADGGWHVLVIDAAGRILAAGDNSYGQFGESILRVSYPTKVADDVIRVSGASDHTTWIKQDGKLWGVGDPYSGQRGANSFSLPLDASVVDTGGSVADVGAGAYYTVYLRQNGTLWGMGNNMSGQLTGTTLSLPTPTQIAAEVAGVAAGGDCTFYISNAGELWGTGYNYSGQLGDGTTTNRASFGKITGAVQSVSTGSGATLILKTDGTLWGTGANWQSQLGGTAGAGWATPIQLAADVIAAAAGGNHTLYVSRGGALWAMGYNFSGQLGDGTTQTRAAAVQVASGVQAVSAAGESSYFIKTDGSLWAMGENSNGELGDGTQQKRLQPVLVTTGVSAISAAPQACYIIKRDRTLWSTGSNYRGRLGIPIVPSRAELAEITLGAPVVDDLSVPVGGNVGGTAQFAVTATGVGELTYQWRKNGSAIAGATGAGYFIGGVTAQDGGVYDVVVTGTRGSTVSNTVLFTVLNAAPVITSALSATAHAGVGFEYRVIANNDAYLFSASGLPHGLSIDPTTGRISGTPDDAAGSYPIAISAGNSQSATQAVLQLEIVAAPPLTGVAAHADSGSGVYFAGDTVTITNTLTYTGTVTGLTWQVLLPDGWSYASGSGSDGQTKPAVGATGLLEWAWSTVPASPVTFTYTLTIPGAATGPQQLAALVGLQGGRPTQVMARPDPLGLSKGTTYHAADTNRDWKLSLLELARVIELYNTRNGGSRTGCYGVQSGSEDGFAPAPTRAANATATLSRYHSADTDHNGRLSLLELARIIELYNQRSGGKRIGQYHVQSGTEDGYATGP
jgi:alpha-tubulin suppressor-like RCC1 family protein